MTYDPLKDLLHKTEAELQKMVPLNLMVVGKTGVGKSTLINAIFRERLAATGQGKPVTDGLYRIEKPGIPLRIYDTKGLELGAHGTKEVSRALEKAIREREADPRERIHLIWYCLQAGSNRVEEVEVRLMEDLAKKAPVVLVLTQAVGEPALDFAQQLRTMDLPVRGIIPLLALDYPVAPGITVPAYGLRELVQLSYELVPQEVLTAFINAQQVDLKKKAKEARRWAKTYIATTFGVGFTPIPFSDAAVLVPLQVSMLAHLTAIYGISLDKSKLAALVASIGGTAGATSLGRYTVSSLLKLIPGAGTLLGGLISGATASLITTALALSYIELMEQMVLREQAGKPMLGPEMQEVLKEFFEKYLASKTKL